MSTMFQFFKAMNRGDYGFVDRMTDDEVKELSAYVLLMWVSGATGDCIEHRHILTTEFVNTVVFTHAKHPRLLLKLFVLTNSELGDARYTFRKSTSKEESAILRLIGRHYDCGLHEARDIRPMLSEKDIKILKEMYE